MQELRPVNAQERPFRRKWITMGRQIGSEEQRLKDLLGQIGDLVGQAGLIEYRVALNQSQGETRICVG